jgi:hypothetical protein
VEVSCAVNEHALWELFHGEKNNKREGEVSGGARKERWRSLGFAPARMGIKGRGKGGGG